MELTHVTHNLRIAPRKLRLVADAMRHKSVDQALGILPLMPQKAAGLFYKALAAAKQTALDHGMNGETLVIQRVMSDEGRKLKRAVHRSRGRMFPIQKFHSHLTIVVKGAEPVAKAARPARTSKKEVVPSEEATTATEA